MSASRQVSVKPERKEDRRVQRTRRLLRDSLIALILERGYDAIRVEDITDHANLGRATFYLHYNDKEDLLASSLRDIFDELVDQFDKPNLADASAQPELIAFKHAEQHRDLYRVMLNGQSVSVLRQVAAYLAEVIQERIMHSTLMSRIPVPVEILAHHMSGSLIQLMVWWL